jgi:DNA-binding transcriptional LysR family regulator
MTAARLDLRLVETFVAVAETLHFGRAGDRLHLAQPAVSQQIGRLEAVIGARLLSRNRRTTALTDAGRAFLPEARRALAVAAGAAEVARAAARGEAGRLRVGIAPSAASRPILAAVRSVLDSAPRVAVEVAELRQRDLIDMLRRGDIDLGIGAVLRLPPLDTGISWRKVVRESFVLALPADHPLAAEPDAVSLSELDAQPFVGFAREDGPRYHDALRELLRSVDVTPSRESVVRERVTQLTLVAAGLGVALVPSGATALRPDGVTYRRLRERTPLLTTIATWRTGDDNPVVTRTLDQLGHARHPSCGAPTTAGWPASANADNVIKP